MSADLLFAGELALSVVDENLQSGGFFSFFSFIRGENEGDSRQLSKTCKNVECHLIPANSIISAYRQNCIR